MDELDLLKKHWQSDGVEDKHLTAQDIYPMLWKKSSSLVKTLFYISIAELVFWIIINVAPMLLSDSYNERVNEIYNNNVVVTLVTILGYAVIVLFAYLLYKSYKSISVTDNAKKLMENILKTRKVIKYYVAYNVIMAFLIMTYSIIEAINNDPRFAEITSKLSDNQRIGMIVGFILVVVVFVLVIWLFYKLLYGILLKRLNTNYKELKKLEV